jgi:hypothetical protein
MRSITSCLLIAFSVLLLSSCFPDRSTRGEKRSTAAKIQTASDARAANLFTAGRSDLLENVLQQKATQSDYGKLPLYFEENRGQADRRVSFLARGAGYDFFLTPNEAVMVFTKSDKGAEMSAKNISAMRSDLRLAKKPESITRDVVRMTFVGSKKNPAITGVDLQSGRSNYFKGKNSREWRTNIPHYSRVAYKELYPGIDVVYYGSQNKLEYDLVVAATSDPSQIRLRMSGAKRLSLDKDGNLVVTTETGEFKQMRAIAHQQIGEERKQVSTRYEIGSDSTIKIVLGDYDKTTELVIDPLIDYSTFLGGSSADVVKDIATDSSGNLFATGFTTSTNFPTTVGAYRTTKVGLTDAFIFKLNPTGTTILYSTFIGSTGEDFGNSIAIDASGNAYITGETRASGFPTMNPRQSNYGGGTSDCFITKLNSTGSGLVYSTYHGGSLLDLCNGIALDSSSNAYVTGWTGSTNFPVASAYQPTLTPDAPGGPGSSAIDAFVSKLNSAGNTLTYSTYLGGGEADQGRGIAVDSAGSAYVAGYTFSDDFDLANPFQSVRGGFWLNQDVFVTKFSPAGNTLVYSTYLGGHLPDATGCFPFCVDDSGDDAYDIAVDSQGAAYVVGYANSTDFPTASAFQGSHQSINNGSDAIVTKLNPQGNTLAFSTYLGGGAADVAYGVTVDNSGNVYVTGKTSSTNFPMASSVQPTSGGGEEVFVTKFNSNGQSLAFSSYLGGSANDVGNTVAVDSSGNIFVAGQTFSTNFPTSTPAQSTNAGAGDGFVTKLTFAPGYDISGQVTKPDGSPAVSVTITLTGGQSRQTTTNASGQYSFPSLPSGRNYTITPSSGIYTFVPANQTVTNLSANQIVNFVVEVYAISGTVMDPTGAPLPLTRIDLTGSVTSAVLTGPDGNYSFINLPGGSYTLTPSKVDPVLTYTFTPPTYTFNNLLSSQTANFVVSSIVTTEISPLADAYVQDGASAGINFGTATTLKSETDSQLNNGKNFDSYLKFDLSTINRNIQTAKIRITASSSTSGAVTTAAYSVASVGWIESGAGSITWTNKPPKGASPILGSNTAITGTTQAVYDVDVTPYIKTEKAAGRNLVSLALHNPTASTLVMTANSREAATGKPKLVVTTTGFPNAAPTIAMTSPANGTSFIAPAAVTVSAIATDIDGTISRVDFYDGTTLIGNATTPVSGSTYSMNWSNVAAGAYALTAIAFDNLGAQRMAVPVSITINPANIPPAVSITSPTNNTTIGAGSNISVSASADDPDGSITQVEFFYGTTSIGTDTTPSNGNSYSVNWNNIPTGVHSVTARATDNNGGITTSAPITVRGVGQIAFSPTADSYVQDGGSASTNFGTATELRSQVGSAGSNRETYLKFDITAATGIEKAVLRLSGALNDASGTNVQANVYPIATTTWVESGSGSITWNNKPAAGGSLLASSIVVNNTEKWYEFDLTSYIQTEKTAGRNTVSFVVKGAAVSSPYIKFNSKEATTNQPQLTMLTTQTRSVLFAVGSTSLVPGDTAIQSRLVSLGFTVTLKVPGSNQNSAIKPTDADGKALVLISSTVNAANVTNKLKNIPVPVLNWEFDVADDFGMTNTGSGVDFGTATNQQNLNLTNLTHPMSAGLSSPVQATTALSSFTWGKPNANAIGIAVLPSDATRFAIFGYETGAGMFGLPAPSRRIGFFLTDATGNVLATGGQALFDAAVKWASRVDTLPLIGGLSPTSGPVGTLVTINGANFGATQGTSAVAFNGTAAAVTSWNTTSISTTVPVGATTGNVIVTVNGFPSNGFLFSVTTPNGDSDGDGLPDSWEMAYFGNLSQGANGDPDGDGVSNLNEYLQGRNPTKGTVSNPSAVDLRVFTPLEP